MFRTNTRAISYKLFGSPDKVLELVNKSITIPSKNEVIVKMTASSINPSDLLAIRGVGTYRDRIKLPAVPGFEGVGVVVAKGEEVNNLDIGQRVLALRGEGTWQEYVRIPESEAIRVPDEVSDKVAAQLYINPLTAWLIMHKLNPSRETIIIADAANSTMGKLFAQFAKIWGYTYIAVTRSDEYTDELMRLGAAHVINITNKNLLDEVLYFTHGNRPHIALEAVGGKVGAELVSTVRSGGKVIIYGNLTLQPLNSSDLINLQTNVSIENFWLRDWAYNKTAQVRQQEFKRMIQFFIEHKIELPVAKEFKLNDMVAAVQEAEAVGKKGKILLTFN